MLLVVVLVLFGLLGSVQVGQGRIIKVVVIRLRISGFPFSSVQDTELFCKLLRNYGRESLSRIRIGLLPWGNVVSSPITLTSYPILQSYNYSLRGETPTKLLQTVVQIHLSTGEAESLVQ